MLYRARMLAGLKMLYSFCLFLLNLNFFICSDFKTYVKSDPCVTNMVYKGYYYRTANYVAQSDWYNVIHPELSPRYIGTDKFAHGNKKHVCNTMFKTGKNKEQRRL